MGMSNREKDNYGSHESFDERALAEQAKEHEERLREDRERAVERSKESNVDEARREALEKATKVEREQKVESREVSAAERRGPITKREKKASYDATMREVHSQMSGPSRAFSSFIHNPTVEKVSDAIGGTVARPNSILAGSVLAFLFTLVIYLIARYFGYALSGSETIASFIIGWLVGLVFDYVRVLFMGKSK